MCEKKSLCLAKDRFSYIGQTVLSAERHQIELMQQMFILFLDPVTVGLQRLKHRLLPRGEKQTSKTCRSLRGNANYMVDCCSRALKSARETVAGVSKWRIHWLDEFGSRDKVTLREFRVGKSSNRITGTFRWWQAFRWRG